MPLKERKQGPSAVTCGTEVNGTAVAQTGLLPACPLSNLPDLNFMGQVTSMSRLGSPSAAQLSGKTERVKYKIVENKIR